ncbi:hypothetical protein RchiOBHm_Chr1g0320701 [Rosa chinensis]|uniref:Uncharacterized protein n=1 Tax=Rosa chinensis TaxID=74649 RepID=A0A2P6S8T0_ROSCH|nr:hypothetical protein RchiOBHm_Chr1g0320701 [Rosa chinensis]
MGFGWAQILFTSLFFYLSILISSRPHTKLFFPIFGKHMNKALLLGFVKCTTPIFKSSKILHQMSWAWTE